MNCRRVNSLLSAYIDSELTGEEMLAVRAHVEHCAECAEELDALLETKHLLSSLAFRAPRADMEELLRTAIEQEEQRPYRRWVENPLLRPLRQAWEAVAYTDIPARPGTVLATITLSVMGLWFASGVVDQMENDRHYRPVGELILLSRMPLAPRTGPANLMPTSSASAYVAAGFGSSGTVVPAYVAGSPDMDSALISPDRYTPPTHLQGGFSADLGFTIGISGVLDRNASRSRRIESALLLR